MNSFSQALGTHYRTRIPKAVKLELSAKKKKRSQNMVKSMTPDLFRSKKLERMSLKRFSKRPRLAQNSFLDDSSQTEFPTIHIKKGQHREPSSFDYYSQVNKRKEESRYFGVVGFRSSINVKNRENLKNAKKSYLRGSRGLSRSVLKDELPSLSYDEVLAQIKQEKSVNMGYRGKPKKSPKMTLEKILTNSVVSPTTGAFQKRLRMLKNIGQKPKLNLVSLSLLDDSGAQPLQKSPKTGSFVAPAPNEPKESPKVAKVVKKRPKVNTNLKKFKQLRQMLNPVSPPITKFRDSSLLEETDFPVKIRQNQIFRKSKIPQKKSSSVVYNSISKFISGEKIGLEAGERTRANKNQKIGFGLYTKNLRNSSIFDPITTHSNLSLAQEGNYNVLNPPKKIKKPRKKKFKFLGDMSPKQFGGLTKSRKNHILDRKKNEIKSQERQNRLETLSFLQFLYEEFLIISGDFEWINPIFLAKEFIDIIPVGKNPIKIVFNVFRLLILPKNIFQNYELFGAKKAHFGVHACQKGAEEEDSGEI